LAILEWVDMPIVDEGPAEEETAAETKPEKEAKEGETAKV